MEQLQAEARCAFCYRPHSSQLGQGELRDWNCELSIEPRTVQRQARASNSLRRRHQLHDRYRTRADLFRAMVHAIDEGLDEVCAPVSYL